jgi:hypothetical protein
VGLTRRRGIILGVVAALVLGWVLVRLLWVTDETKLHRLVAAVERAVEARDAEACVALADEESWDWLGTRAELVALLQRLFATYDLRDVMVVQEEVSVEPPDPEAGDGLPRGAARVRTIVTSGPRSPFPGPVRNTWLITCIKRDGRWLVSQARVQLEGGSEESISSLLGRVPSDQ